MKVLITGAGGFIGRNLREALCPEHEVAAPARAELDLLDENQVYCYLRRNRFDAVVHAAGARANRKTGAPEGLLHHNCRMFFNLARNRDCFERMLFLSSGAVYDRRYPVARVTEDCFDRHVPSGDYGFSKYLCAQYLAGIENIWELRLFGVFGPHEDWEVRFLSNACCRAVWDLPIVIRRNVNFDYLDVADLAAVVAWFLEGQPRHPAYNVCSGRTFDLVTLAGKILRAAGKDLPVCVKQEGLGPEYSGDNARLLEEVPWLKLRDMDESIGGLYRFYLARKETIDPARLHFDS